jgi:hypothetical protein
MSATRHCLMPGYSTRSLPDKLGIKPGATVILLGGPPGYAKLVSPLPAGASIVTQLSPGAKFIHQFARLRIELEAEIPRADRALADDGVLWVSWPKKAARLGTDVTEDVVREVALPLGLVDVKVCAVDEIWSGLKLVRRKERRG